MFPPRGRLKINFDGAYSSELKKGGIGVIVRDDTGKCLTALTRFFPYAASALHMEVEACRAGLLMFFF